MPTPIDEQKMLLFQAEQKFGADHPKIADLLKNLAVSYNFV